jgi:type III secretory pathway component EscT
MAFWTLFTVYSLIAAFAAFRSRQEQKRRGGLSLINSILSLAACVAWPAMVIFVLVASQMGRNEFAGVEAEQ